MLLYRGSLENPPLLLVCDLERLIIRTNFTGTVEKVHHIEIDQLGRPENLDKIGWVFHDPEKLRPAVTREAITIKVAGQLARIAQGMRERGIHPLAVAPLSQSPQRSGRNLGIVCYEQLVAGRGLSR